MRKGAPRDAHARETVSRSVASGSDGAALARAARRPGAVVLVACPRDMARQAPDAVERIVRSLARLCAPAPVVPPGRISPGLWPLATRDGAILVVIARPDRSLGRDSAHELGAFRRERRPAFVVLPGRGLVDARRLRLRALPPPDRTDRLFGHLEEREP